MSRGRQQTDAISHKSDLEREALCHTLGMTEPRKPMPSLSSRLRPDEIIGMVTELKRLFEKERSGRAPFEVKLPCNICQKGVVNCWYEGPLYGGMTCDTPGCLQLNF
jgi:hypothetical protein